MKTKDRIREEIGLDKLFIGIISAASFSLIAWAWRQDFVLNAKNIAVYFAIFVSALFLFVAYKKIMNKIKKLDEYD